MKEIENDLEDLTYQLTSFNIQLELLRAWQLLKNKIKEPEDLIKEFDKLINYYYGK